MKRVISLILVFCFIALALVACGNKKGNETSASSSSTSGTKATNKYGEEVLDETINWDEVDCEGETVNIL